jgi:hypothetical protein
MPSIRIFAYLFQLAILLLLVFVVPLGPHGHWIIAVYILVSLFAIRFVRARHGS